MLTYDQVEDILLEIVAGLHVGRGLSITLFSEPPEKFPAAQ